MLDLDGFKRVNDTEGHNAGDALIAACAEALRGRLRDSDVLARLGGDEFALLLPAGGREAAQIVADALVAVLRERGGGITASIGVALTDEPELGAEAILAQADRAMYAAKRAGGDRYAVAPPAGAAT
jgi:diguanylate cyclase (GGDEF)-like protein